MSIGEPEPSEIRHRRGARTLEIDWSDSHRSVFPLDYLRSWCPCAGCQGHAATPSYLGLTGQSLHHIEAVGNYAVTLAWADGHDTGIWNFRRFRELCPCDSCGGEKR
jgi:DUF971 family protein